eukprot:3296992-Pyramimonas_sp.AAC.1
MLSAKISNPRSEDGGSSLLGGRVGPRTTRGARTRLGPRASDVETSPNLATLGSWTRGAHVEPEIFQPKLGDSRI